MHGPDEQRFYNTVCLFYGGNPEEREDFAQDLGLPETRAYTCPDEFDLAWDSWGPAFDEIEGAGRSMLFDAGGFEGTLTADVMADEVASMSQTFVLPETLVIRVGACGEANAFFDPSTTEIIMCIEFEDHLREMFAIWN